MKKLLGLFMLTAIIRSSEIKEVQGHHWSALRLCAFFDIQRDGKTIEQSYQCGEDWELIEKGIRYQLNRKQQTEEEATTEANRIIHLKSIKNDEIGKVIKP